MSSFVLDASAVLALLNQENGHEQVAGAVVQGCWLGTVNLSEVVAKLSEAGVPEAAIREALDALEIEVVSFEREDAFATGFLRSATRVAGLSLGDRACLELAQRLGVPVLTADHTWKQLSLAIDIRVIR